MEFLLLPILQQAKNNNALQKRLEETFKKPPYNAAFGMYIYLQNNDVNPTFLNSE